MGYKPYMIGIDWLLFMGFHAGKYIQILSARVFFAKNSTFVKKPSGLVILWLSWHPNICITKKKNWLVAFYHQSEANMLVKMGSSSPIFRVNMLKVRELPPARKTSTPFLDVSSACLRLSSSSTDVTTVTFPIGTVVSSGMKTRGAFSWCDHKGGS